MRFVFTMLERATLILTVGLLCAMVATTASQVASRYLLNISLVWTEELGRHLMIWMVFLASTVIYRRGQHIKIDLLGERLPRLARLLVGLLVTLVLAYFFYLMVRYGWELTTRTMNQRSSAMRYPMGYAYASLPVGGALLLLYSLESAVRQVVEMVRPSPEPHDGAEA